MKDKLLESFLDLYNELMEEADDKTPATSLGHEVWILNESNADNIEQETSAPDNHLDTDPWFAVSVTSGSKYRIKPFNRDEALVTLVLVDDKGEEVPDANVKVLKGDLYTDYDIHNYNDELISSAEDVTQTNDDESLKSESLQESIYSNKRLRLSCEPEELLKSLAALRMLGESESTRPQFEKAINAIKQGTSPISFEVSGKKYNINLSDIKNMISHNEFPFLKHFLLAPDSIIYDAIVNKNDSGLRKELKIDKSLPASEMAWARCDSLIKSLTAELETEKDPKIRHNITARINGCKKDIERKYRPVRNALISTEEPAHTNLCNLLGIQTKLSPISDWIGGTLLLKAFRSSRGRIQDNQEKPHGATSIKHDNNKEDDDKQSQTNQQAKSNSSKKDEPNADIEKTVEEVANTVNDIKSAIGESLLTEAESPITQAKELGQKGLDDGRTSMQPLFDSSEMMSAVKTYPKNSDDGVDYCKAYLAIGDLMVNYCTSKFNSVPNKTSKEASKWADKAARYGDDKLKGLQDLAKEKKKDKNAKTKKEKEKDKKPISTKDSSTES